MCNSVCMSMGQGELPWWLSGKESACRRLRFDPLVGKIPWRRAWQPIPVFLPRDSHRQRSLVGYSPRGCRVRHVWSDWACRRVCDCVCVWCMSASLCGSWDDSGSWLKNGQELSKAKDTGGWSSYCISYPNSDDRTVLWFLRGWRNKVGSVRA